MSSFFTLELITAPRTHLWRDVIFFLEQTVKCRDSWFTGTYARATVLFTVTAFEAYCAELFEDADLSNKKGAKGILKGIKHKLPDLDLEDPFWQKVASKIRLRNSFGHASVRTMDGKKIITQEELFADPCEAGDTAITLLSAAKEITKMVGRVEEQWMDDYMNQLHEILAD